MIPNSNTITTEIEEINYPGRTYKINISVDLPHRISGYVDDIEAIKQAIFLILSTERCKHIIYSWDYGVELMDLIGQPMPYVMSEIPRRIEEALIQDNRIEKTENYEFERNKGTLTVTFTVVTTLGDYPTELEVSV